MYEQQGLQDIFFIMLYGGVTLLSVLSCCYLLFTHGNLFTSSITPPRNLRLWAAAFLASIALSHVWWYLLGIYYLQNDILTRNIIAITLDRLSIVPLMMCTLLRMLQDRKRPLWPIAVAIIPILLIAIVCLATHNDHYEMYVEYYSILLGVSFTVYYVLCVLQYSRWLSENYADLNHKEIWQSLLLLAFILFIYIAYASNGGDLVTEYLAQINTIIIIIFVLWRVENLQQLTPTPIEEKTKNRMGPMNIGELLEKHCEKEKLYLQRDLTLQQLASAIGTNRTYLGNHFAQNGITYNHYINWHRILHFIELYHNAKETNEPFTAKALAIQSGFNSYATFYSAFKKFTNQTVTEWMKKEEEKTQETKV